MLHLFDKFSLDGKRRELRREGVLVPIEPQVFDLLQFLVTNRERVVSKDDLLASVWGGRIVSESTLLSRINAARRVIGDNGEEQRLIRTIIGKGVRFVGQTLERQNTDQSDVPLIAPRLSIVVLPFTNLSGEPEHQYFADGITEDVTTDLSRLENMFVISRNTAFTYRNKPINTKQIGRELGVRYVLEGSVRRSGNKLRVSAQLIDAASDAHLWAERFDGETADPLALQNEITSQIANALGVELIAAEAARPTENPDALDQILQGRAARLKPNSRAVYAEAISLFERALALDPHSVEAQTCLAGSLVSRVMNGMTDSAADDLVDAERLVSEALAVSPRCASAHYVKGELLRARGRYEEAIPEYETALALNRNLMVALTGLAWCKLYAGFIEEVIPLEEQAIRLSLREPWLGHCYYLIGTVHLLQSRTDESIVWFERGRSALPGIPFHHSRLASAYALKGDTGRAAAELAEAQRLDGGDLFSSIAHLRAHPGAWSGAPKIRALYEATYFAGLRKAGMPEE